MIWIFLGFGCGPLQDSLISQCAAVWIRAVKMTGTDEHMHVVYASTGHFYGE